MDCSLSRASPSSPNGPTAKFAARLRAATPFELYRRTFHAPEGTEHATISRQRTQQSSTAFALVEENARVGGHFFLCADAAFGARDDGSKRYFHGDFSTLYA